MSNKFRERVTLAEIAIVERGKFSVRPRNDPKYYGGIMPFIQTSDVSLSKGVVSKFSQTLNNEGIKVSKLFPKGSLVITIAANIGDIAEVDFDFCCPDSLVVVQPHKSVCKTWLKYFLQTKKQYFKAMATQNAQANINLQIIKPLEITLPPLEKQKRIADILWFWDTAIQKMELLIEKKQKCFRQLQYQLINGIVFEDSKKWPSIRLAKITKKEKGKSVVLNKEKQGIPYIGSDSFSGNFKEYTCSNDIICCASEDVLLLWDGENAGKVTTGLTGAVGSTVCVLRINNYAYNEFVFSHLDMSRVKIRAIREGSGIPHIPGDFLHWYNLKLPPLETQKKIGCILKYGRSEIMLLQSQLEKLKIQKYGLMQQLLTGKIKIK